MQKLQVSSLKDFIYVYKQPLAEENCIVILKTESFECTFQFNKILIVWSYLVIMSLEYELTSKSKVILRCKDFYDYDFNDEKCTLLLEIKLKTFPINDIRITLRTKRGTLDTKMFLSYYFLC